MEVRTLLSVSGRGEHSLTDPDNPYGHYHDALAIRFVSPARSVAWASHWVWDSATWECSNYAGGVPADDWLDALAAGYLSSPGAVRRKIVSDLRESSSARELAEVVYFLAGDCDRSHTFLDSFSVIENDEEAKRVDRPILPSATTRALLTIAGQSPDMLDMRSPREFELLVASVLAELGFSRVTLRRYSKDGGADIVAILADGKESETIVVEVKHGKRPAGLEVLDRLNGARDRLSADRAVLVTSSYVTRDARNAYTAKSDYVSVYTFHELAALLRDAPGWSQSPRGLWSRQV